MTTVFMSSFGTEKARRALQQPLSVSHEADTGACDGCRFGTEHEKLGYNLADNTRLGYEKIRALLEGLCERFGWEPVMEGEYIIGAELDGQNVSLEPGGQFELSGAPLDTLHKTCAEVANHLYQVMRAPTHQDGQSSTRLPAACPPLHSVPFPSSLDVMKSDCTAS